jgi:hypothetical protein
MVSGFCGGPECGTPVEGDRKVALGNLLVSLRIRNLRIPLLQLHDLASGGVGRRRVGDLLGVSGYE